MSNDNINDQNFYDTKDYQAKFMLTPDINLGVDFAHLDKNLAITNFKHNPRHGINEPEQARSILRALHILNNPKYYREVVVSDFVGNREVKQSDGSIVLIPVYQEKKLLKPIFPKTFHNLRSEFISLTNTAAARGGHRIQSAITNRIAEDKTILDSTERKNGFGFFNKRGKDYD